jgi:ribosomal-protein-alanine N-acetyltransferase
VTLREEGGNVAIVVATIASLDAEEIGGADAAGVLGVLPPASWPPEYNDASTRQWMREMIMRHPDEPGYGSWYVVGDGRLVGTAGYKGPPDPNGEVEIGYAIIESERLRGYASGAVRLLVERAFRDPRVRAVAAETIPELAGSRAVLERCGFTLIARTPNTEVGEILRYRLGRSS